MERKWPVLLFSKSVLKQRKLKEITGLLGKTVGLHCLDIGSDNGVISYFLRNRGGNWKSADLNEKAVKSIRELVDNDVYQIDGLKTEFNDNEFDRVVIIDFLEHIRSEREFIDEVYRILKPGGELIINVPHIKNSLLRKIRLAIGQTDEKHGHLRPGYTLAGISSLFKGKFSIETFKTYSKFFSECIDTLITFAFSLLKKGKADSSKGQIVTGKDMKQFQKIFRAYSIIYPVIWFFSKMDSLLFFVSGYMLIVKVRVDKEGVRS